MNGSGDKWWPFGLLIGGAVLLWGPGYSWRDSGSITFMALFSASDYVVAIERQKCRQKY
ncbi:hypothetical protein [Bradyrhizobium canariense]|uniref:Uncharacterized protein n=1 Tax=Bradyrhizobium canariense TaxID=255045 RepID=A0A1H1YJZ8_9BRAD|nr:hypothetical protein [Bradyrhizobium canariense]SDT21753.1 hypothetical protein SAMN05444158_4856 [Bradyrhizobium canariense]